MAITEWHEPIHECQEGEVQREWCYLHQYYPFYGNLKQYADLLEYAFKKQYAQNMPKPCPIFDNYLEKHDIEFFIDDIKKGRPPSHNQLKHWNKGSNVKCNIKHSWNDRRGSKRNEIEKLNDEYTAILYAENMPYILNRILNDFKEIDDVIEDSKLRGFISPHQIEAITKARSHSVDSFRKISNKDNKKIDVKGDIKTKSKIENKLFTDELKDYNLDDAYDEVTEDVDN